MNKDIEYSISEISSLSLVLESCHSIVVLPHTSPDGDAIGASLGLCRTLRNIYPDKRIDIVSPDSLEKYLYWMTELGDINIWGSDNAVDIIENADLFIHLDHNDLKRLKHSSMIEAIRKNTCKRIMIDHHLYPSKDFDLVISRPIMSSTCEMVFSLIKRLNWVHHLDIDGATAILTGIITDTGRFLYNCPLPSVFNATAELIAKGAKMDYINDQLNYHSPINRIKFHGYAVDRKMEIREDLSCAVITISKEDMIEYSVNKGDTEGLANLPLEIEGVSCSCLIREDADQIKLSFRSIGSFPVNRIAEKFGGGGHLNAAGGEYHGSIEDAKTKYFELVKVLSRELNK